MNGIKASTGIHIFLGIRKWWGRKGSNGFIKFQEYGKVGDFFFFLAVKIAHDKNLD